VSPILGIIASSKFAAVGDFESIATVTVGAGGASSVDFTSIPSTYTHLQIRALVKPAVAANIGIRYNSDTGANYIAHYLAGDGASPLAATANLGVAGAWLGYAGSSTIFSTFVLDILDYASVNKNKTGRILFGHDTNGAGNIILASHAWFASSSAVTSISLLAGGSTLTQYSHFALYGIKVAS
jgi:hypothetical protein